MMFPGESSYSGLTRGLAPGLTGGGGGSGALGKINPNSAPELA
jgi:hypothetical protein